MGTIKIPRRAFIQGVAAAGAVSWTSLRAFGGGDWNANNALERAMERAAKCCLAWLNPAEHYLPVGGYEPAHDTGRWWDAMLRYEAETGVRIPDPMESAMMENLHALTDNPAALLASDLCNPHNLRESLLAYTALVEHRQSDWARQQGRTLVDTILSLLGTDGQLDYEQLAVRVGKPLTADPLMIHRASVGQWFNATAATGRALEALVWFHAATGDTAALDLARRLAAVHLRQTVDPAGKVRAELLDPHHVGHNHSYLGTLRGLVLYALASGEQQYVDAVALTYRRGLWGTTVSHSGWTPHDQGKTRFPDGAGDPVGEHASCGDVAQIALWLALRHGHTELLDDVERLVRARLLPSQIVDANDPRRDGAWGVYADGFDRGSILDVIAAVLHSLIDIHHAVVTQEADDSVSVNLHFDVDTPFVTVQSQRDASATLAITPKQRFPLRIRVPAWAARDSVQVQLAGQSLPWRWDGSFAFIAQERITPNTTITLQHDLPQRETVEELPVSHRRFRLHWRGDDVIACEPRVPIYAEEKNSQGKGDGT